MAHGLFASLLIGTIINTIGTFIPGVVGEFLMGISTHTSAVQGAAMALAIGESEAVKILVPMERCHIRVAAEPGPVSRYLDRAMELVGEELDRLTQA